MSIYESSITNPKKQLEFYKQLSEQLQQENKILKENAEHNDKVVDKVNWENMLLKKQLEDKYSRTGTLTNEVLYEENSKLINQQKEFIKWLENMLDNENDIF